MAFEKVEKRAGGGAAANGVAASLTKGTAGKLKVRIGIGGDVAKAAGWKAGQHIALFRGTDADIGKVRLFAADSGYRLAKSGGNTFALMAAPWPGITGQDAIAAKACAWRVVTEGQLKGVEVTLPSWAGKATQRFEDEPRAVRNNRI